MAEKLRKREGRWCARMRVTGLHASPLGFSMILPKVFVFSGQDICPPSVGLIAPYQMPTDLLSGHRKCPCGWPVVETLETRLGMASIFKPA